MMTSKGMKAVVLLSITVVCVSILTIGLQEKVGVTLPTPMADIWRVVVMGEAGYAGAMLILLILRGMKMKLDPGDKLLKPASTWVAGNMILILYVCLSLAAYFKDARISWRTPMAFLGCFFLDISVTVIYQRLMVMLQGHQKGTFKLTITDTSSQGLDIDLSTNKPILPRQKA